MQFKQRDTVKRKRLADVLQMLILSTVALAFTLSISGCLQDLGEAARIQLEARDQPQNYSKLMLFGGEDNKQYLGCLSCSESALDSITNRYGTYGNQFSRVSIWNPSGTYGSPYSQYSPWNRFATHPPVIVDQNRNFYGYFTINELFPRRTQIIWIVEILDTTGKLMKQ